MFKNLKKRIYTSIALLFLVFLIFINNFALCYFLIVIGLLSLLEFFKIIKIILKENKIKQFFINLLFIIYIFSFCSIFLILSSYLYLKIIIFIILLTCIASDIGGLLFGKIFKGRKLIKISPNKTISGAIGSLIFSVITASTLIYYLSKNFDPYFLIIGFIISAASQMGDLFFSFLKRKSFLKDTGNILPGHGGILDRIDGILLGLPIGFITLLIFN